MGMKFILLWLWACTLPIPTLLATDLRRPVNVSQTLLATDLRRYISLPPRQSTFAHHAQPVDVAEVSRPLQTAPTWLTDHALLPLRKGWTKTHASLLRLWSSHAAPTHEQLQPFHPDDARSSATFLGLVAALLLIDGATLRNNGCSTTLHKKAGLHWAFAALPAMFWISCAFIFGVYIYTTRSSTDALYWATAYLLEWMMSAQHLFVARDIFEAHSTPPAQRDAVLHWCSPLAALLRLALFATENCLLRWFAWSYVVLGLFLLYRAEKAVSAAKLQDSPTLGEQPKSVMQGWLLACVPFVDRYSPRGHLFESAPVNAASGEPVAPGCPVSANPATGFSETPHTRLVATRLAVVSLQLVASDAVLAIGSVSIVTAHVPDFFLASTASILATLGVRTLLFATDELASWCELLPYTVATVLALFGAKLLLMRWLQVPVGGLLLTLIVVVALSSLGAFLQLRRQQQPAGSQPAASRRARDSLQRLPRR